MGGWGGWVAWGGWGGFGGWGGWGGRGGRGGWGGGELIVPPPPPFNPFPDHAAMRLVKNDLPFTKSILNRVLEVFLCFGGRDSQDTGKLIAFTD